MMRCAVTIAAALFLRVAAAATPADYAYTFPIETSPPASGGAGTSSAWRIELTPEAYAWVQDADLRDLAVFNAANQPVPVARIRSAPAALTREHLLALPTLALPAAAATSNGNDLRLVIDRDADGRLRRIDAGEQAAANARPRDWLIDATALDRAVDGFALDWSAPTSGVSARFAVAASDDLQSWRDLGTAGVVALERDGVRIDRREFAVAPTRARYFRLHRLDDGAELDGLSVQARSTERTQNESPRSWLRAEPAAASDTPDGFDYALPARLPADRARVELANDNALAQLTLLARGDDAATWRPLAQFDAYRLRQGEGIVRNDDVELPPGPPLRTFRIRSRTPLAAAPQLTLGYRADAFVFLAEGAGPYTLAVGSRSAHRPDYPVDTALASLRTTLGRDWQPPTATLGAARVSAGDVALRAPEPPLPWQRWLLWAVLVAGAAAVGGFALSLLREKKQDLSK
ncbi:DUF3999 domain-containing protein [Dokdonella sp.]|uniref:DUF3999 domain-containing protein n=1 Tax=Dokdonella sp. TaxID=2291710 RepID=UPI001B131110|nr:DUF3999 domain-containing protein [Dokdonella sp.]MBO9664324.1 DUF3999 domain-containing protein [Dokdonella sp.]